MYSSRILRPRGFVIFSVVLLAFTWAVCGGTAHADTLGALVGVEKASPDICTTSLVASYTANTTTGTGSFVATGWPSGYSRVDDPMMDQIIDCVGDQKFHLEATLPITATVPASVCDGTFAISGRLWDANYETMYYEGMLLTGDLQEFGFTIDSGLDPNTTIFDFRFTVTGGHFADDYGGIGGQGGIIIAPKADFFDTAFTGSLESDFGFECLCSMPYGTADTFAVPEPSSAALALVLMAVSLASFVMRRSWMRGAGC